MIMHLRDDMWASVYYLGGICSLKAIICLAQVVHLNASSHELGYGVILFVQFN